jgi:hypothetical protein
VNSNGHSNTKKELYKRAQQLGVEKRSRMNKAELAEAVALKEMDSPSTTSSQSAVQESTKQEREPRTQQVRDPLRTAAEQEVRLAVWRVQEAARSAAESATRQVRTAAEQEARLAVRRVREAARLAAQEPEQGTVQPSRAARQRSESRPRRMARGFLSAILVPVFVALLTSMFTSNYVSSKVFDRAFRAGTDPVSTKVFFDRDNGVQGLTWALHGGLGPLSINDEALLQRAGGSVNEFNEWMRDRGGVDVDVSFIKLIVTGQRKAGVAIIDMRAKIDHCGPPLTGALLYGPPEGEQGNVQIGLNLDENVPVARLVNSNKSFGDPNYLGREYFKVNTIPLSLGEDQVFSVAAMTRSRYCLWYIDLGVFVDGHRQDITIGYKPDGVQKQRPFEITARADLRNGGKGNFSFYRELYILDKSTPPGFTAVDPRTYVP